MELCTHPAAVHNRMSGWVYDDDRYWKPVAEHNYIELAVHIHKNDNYFLIQMQGNDTVSIHCVRGCMCNEGVLSERVHEIPVRTRIKNGEKGNKCFFRLSGQSRTGFGVPDVRITAAGFGCVNLHHKTHFGVI